MANHPSDHSSQLACVGGGEFVERRAVAGPSTADDLGRIALHTASLRTAGRRVNGTDFKRVAENERGTV